MRNSDICLEKRLREVLAKYDFFKTWCVLMLYSSLSALIQCNQGTKKLKKNPIRGKNEAQV